MGLDHPQSTEDSHAILADLKSQSVEKLETQTQRLTSIIKALREQCTKAIERADQAEYMLKAAGLSDINHYMTQLKEQAALIEHKDQHIRTQAVEIVSLRRQLNDLKSGKNVAQEWHDEPGDKREDLP
ncbi:hypothetical protein COW36_06750 [bacterium (Candidatus Blackallbacteria) CG17_big_fil_post_rev_8_21_14_2_50_48_46]|uniref:Uncharacterized protein n=1 Tax=bacterium (Candidatus Blackallbacteria) CG17_big_fil_post_rev_8_21_14_2_50_48_46 TaxID=2014261 RepID=A0A2M7G7C0_9BACT|nr:MAG: hypothetical protein COW36_06750 [bacterium (Candidatus Blackallbacteria) CG17_big_fil_post_rev_8_21_14_2_50_48_46]PIW45789.1 MAG: hypothetical protein COW20_18845 [bacterium (Candidatus Blackallbacteria) CG13_big_fil_rev_8_21_14_2_50_49_14]